MRHSWFKNQKSVHFKESRKESGAQCRRSFWNGKEWGPGLRSGGYLQKEGFPTRTRPSMLPSSSVLVPKLLSLVSLKRCSKPSLLGSPPPATSSFSLYNFIITSQRRMKALDSLSQLAPSRCHTHPASPMVSVDGGSSHPCLSISHPWHSCLCHCLHSRPLSPFNKMEHE